MSLLLSGILLVLMGFLFSQFGGKLNAKNSLIWWFILVFLLFCTLYPQGLVPLAQLLGIQLVSNLVLAGLILFLIFQAIQESAYSTELSRKLRDAVSSAAAREYCEKNKNRIAAEMQSKKKKVLVIFPTFNEEKTLPEILQEAAKVFGTQASSSASSASERFSFFYCFVNDGSSDESELILEEYASENSVHLHVHLATNIGVAGALLTGFKILKKANFDYVVQCDADGQHPIHLVPELVLKAEALRADLMIGSRYLRSLSHESSTGLRRFGSLLIVFSLKLFSFRLTIADPTSGFRVYSKRAGLSLMKKMPEEYPEPETAALLMLEKMKVHEMETPMKPRQGGISSISGFKSFQFMLKVLSALLGLRLRSWLS